MLYTFISLKSQLQQLQQLIKTFRGLKYVDPYVKDAPGYDDSVQITLEGAPSIVTDFQEAATELPERLTPPNVTGTIRYWATGDFGDKTGFHNGLVVAHPYDAARMISEKGFNVMLQHTGHPKHVIVWVDDQRFQTR